MALRPVPFSRLLVLLLVAAVALPACASDGGGPGAVACTGTEAQLRAEGALAVGADLSAPPFAFLDDAGKVTGFEVELLRAAGRIMNVDVRFVDQSVPGLIPGLLAGHFDAVAGDLRATPELVAQACPTEPLLPGDLAIVVNPGRTPDIDGADGVDGAVAVVAGEPGEAWARANLEAADVRDSPTVDDVFNSLRDGAVQAVVTDLPTAAWRAKDDADFEVVEEMDVEQDYVAFVDPANRGLRDAIDDAVRRLREDGAYARLFERWFGRPPPDD